MDWGSCTAGQPSISPLDSSFAREREGHGGVTFGLNHGEVDERRQAKEKRHNLPCTRVPVSVCARMPVLISSRMRVRWCMGGWRLVCADDRQGAHVRWCTGGWRLACAVNDFVISWSKPLEYLSYGPLFFAPLVL